MNKWVDPYDKEKFIEVKEDHIVCKGGDGTLLRAVKMHGKLGLPFLPLAGGTKNFLMNKEPLDNTDLKPVQYNLIKICVDGNEWYAFNEVAIGSFCGWNEFSCEDEDELLGEFKGAGLSISTAQGSTGLNRNADGAVLSLNSKHWSVKGMETDRSINYSIKPENILIDVNSRDTFMMKVDGKVVRTRKNMLVEISQGPVVNVLYSDLTEIKARRRL